jgi:hypothetical protein
MLIVEVVVSAQPFGHLFQKHGKCATLSLLTYLWEKCDTFNVTGDFKFSSLKLPRKWNQWIMKLFKQKGFCKNNLERLNKVRIHYKF